MAVQYFQYILPVRTTTWGQEEIRITRQSRIPYLQRNRGVYDGAAIYATNDVVYDGTTKLWRSLQNANTGNALVEGAFWTAANNFDFVQADQSKVLYIDKGYRLFTKGGVSALRKFIAPKAGNTLRGTRDFNFFDYLKFTGVDGLGNVINEDCTAQPWRSLINRIFDDPTSLTTIYGSRVLPATTGAYNAGTTYHSGDIVTFGGDTWQSKATQTGVAPGTEDITKWERARELAWMGDGKVELLTTRDYAVLAERSVNAIQIQTAKITIDAFTARSDSFQVQDVFPLISLADMMEPTRSSQIVGGIIPYPDAHFDNGFVDYAYVFATFFPDDHSQLQIAGVDIDANLHGMTYATMLAKICQLCNWSFDPVNDFDSGLTAWSDITDQTTNLTTSVQILPAGGQSLLQRLGKVYEYWLGSNPLCNLNVAQITSSTTHDWGSPVTDIVTEIADQFGCAVRQNIDQTNKRPRLRLVDRRRLNTDSTTATTTTGTVTAGALTIAVTSASTLKGSKSYPFWAQLTKNGVVEAVKVTADNGSNVLTVVRIGTGLAWTSGVAIAAIKELPASPIWKLGTESERDAQVLSESHIEIGVKGDKDVFACPRKQGVGLKVEVGARAKKLGPLGSYGGRVFDISMNTDVEQGKQYSYFQVYSGGPSFSGRHIYMGDASISATTPAIDADGNTMFLISSARDFTYLVGNDGGRDNGNSVQDITAGSIERTMRDMFLFENGAIGLLTNIVDRNKVVVTVHGLSTQPATGTNKKFLVGYTTGAQTGINDSGWMFDVTATDNSNQIKTTHQLVIGGIIGSDIYGQSFQGQQYILPARGVFTVMDLTWDGVHTTLTLDSPIEIGGTNLEGRFGGPQLNPDGAVACSFMVYLNTTDKRFRKDAYAHDEPAGSFSDGNPGPYDPGVTANSTNRFWRNADRTQPDIFRGLYTVSRIQFCPLVDSSGVPIIPDDDHGNSIYSLAQLRAHELGSFTQLTRKYDGVKGDASGSLTSYDIFDSIHEYNYGANRNFYTVGIETDEAETAEQASTIVKLMEWPDVSAGLDTDKYTVVKIGGGGTSGGGGEIGGSGSGGGLSSGGSSSSTWRPDKLLTLGGFGAVQIPATDQAILVTDVHVTGLKKPLSPSVPDTLMITNKTGADWTAGNFFLANNETWLLYYDGTVTQSDPTLPAGWNLIR